MIKKCLGCGTLMQNEDINRPGYTTDISRDYCKRCFRLMHYNEIPKVFATNKEFLQVIDYQLKKKNLFIYLIDIFSFPISFNKDITDRLRGKDVIIVINKIDLLPKSLNPQNLINFVSKQCEKIFFKVVAIHLISAKKGYYLTDLMQHLELFRKERDICILGLASVGKSSFINAFASTNCSLTSNLIGAGKSEEVLPLCKRIVLLCYAIIIPVGLLIALFPSLILRIYTDNPELIAASIPSLWVMLSSHLIAAPAFICFFCVSGTGNTQVAFQFELLSVFVYTLYTVYIVYYVYADVAVCWTTEHVYDTMVLLSLIYLRSGRWKLKKIQL